MAYQWETFTGGQAALSCFLLAATAVAYRGIVDDHAEAKTAPRKTGAGGKGAPLAGGASLDLLGLVVVVQFGTCLLSRKFVYLLAALPLWGIWKLYNIIYGGSGGPANPFGGGATDAVEKEEVDEATAERRKKRAERRKMKR